MVLGKHPEPQIRRLHELTGDDSVPQAIVDGEPIGDYEELVGLVRSGALAPLRDQ